MLNERLKEIESWKLYNGPHPEHQKALEKQMCVMEMVAYVAGEPWSDHPQCACPILTVYAIRLNDRFNDEHRQLLKPFITALIGTRATDEVQVARKRLVRWRNVTVTYPIILECYKLNEMASELRQFKNTLLGMEKAAAFLKENREAIYKAADAYANADAHTYADAYAYANADAYAYANADAYAYANADANADALRQKLAEVSVETLRLAIEVNGN